MFVELHIIQNFAPSNLNRDDTNAPKDCEFGGFRRARISSQCIKRSVRSEFSRSQLLDEAHLSQRTRRLVDALVDRLLNDERDTDTVRRVAEFAVAAAGLGLKDGRTQYLLFLASDSIREFASLIEANWDEIAAAVAAQQEAAESGKKAKKAAKAEAPAVLKEALNSLLDGSRAADLALFGRMLADLPGKNVDAAAQVAHAISTNKVEMEFDFYTAVDDLQQSEETGAGMMGTVEFNSSCFYRYANVDLDQLLSNLGGDSELAERTVAAFVRASVLAIPTGKQNSMAAQNQPSFVLAVVRDSGLWSLANAFVKPVWPRRDDDLVTASIARLDAFWGQLEENYGSAGIREKAALALGEDGLTNLKKARVKSNGQTSALDAVIERVLAATRGEGGQS